MSVTLAILLLAANFGQSAFDFDATVEGTYRIDRWNQHSINELFVSTSVVPDLAPYVGKYIRVQATIADNSADSSHAVLKLNDKVASLSQPVSIRLEYEAKDAQPQSKLKRIKRGETALIRITVSNLGDQVVELDESRLSLVFALRDPSGPNGPALEEDPFNWWLCTRRHREYDNEATRVDWCLHPESFAMSPREAVFALSSEARSSHDQSYRVLTDPNMVSLEPGKSHSWPVTIRDLPANEYEISVAYRHAKGSGDKSSRIHSNALRLDVLSSEPKPWKNGLQATLNVATARPDGGYDARVIIQNRGKQTVTVSLMKTGQEIHFEQGLNCYDTEGRLLYLTTPKGAFAFTRIEFPPGKTVEVPVRLPSAASLARVVMFLSFYDSEISAIPDDALPDSGFMWSQHVLITP